MHNTLRYMIYETKEPAAQGARNKGTVCAKAHGPNDNDYITNNYEGKSRK